jgi:hypothetical protein
LQASTHQLVAGIKSTNSRDLNIIGTTCKINYFHRLKSTHTIDLGLAGFLVHMENLGAWPPILLLAVAAQMK